MKDTNIAATAGATLVTRALEHESHVDWFLTGRPVTVSSAAETAREVFGQAADFLAANHIQVLHEKVYGLRIERDRILAERRSALANRGLDPSVLVTFLEGVPADGGRFGGVQIQGAAPRNRGEQLIHTDRHWTRNPRIDSGPGLQLRAEARNQRRQSLPIDLAVT
jgi:hypothetical protein